MKVLIFIILLFCSAAVEAQDTAQHTIPGRTNSAQQENKPYVILISADGFRYNYPEQYKAVHLLEFASEGVRASSYPNSSFPECGYLSFGHTDSGSHVYRQN